MNRLRPGLTTLYNIVRHYFDGGAFFLLGVLPCVMLALGFFFAHVKLPERLKDDERRISVQLWQAMVEGKGHGDALGPMLGQPVEKDRYWIEAPAEVESYVRDAFRDEGKNLASSPKEATFFIRASSKEVPSSKTGEKLIVWSYKQGTKDVSLAQEMAFSQIVNAGVRSAHEASPHFKAVPEVNLTLSKSAREGLLGEMRALIGPAFMGGAFLFILFISTWGASIHGVMLDMERSMGATEPLAFCHQPLWAWYGGRLGVHAVVSAACCGALLAGLKLGGAPLPLVGILVATLLIPVLVVWVGLWSIFTTVLFHHSMGRMFARIVLSPFVLIFVWGIRLMMLQATNEARDPGELMRVIASVPYQLGIMLAVGASLSLLTPALVWAIEKRIGARRQGLRKA